MPCLTGLINCLLSGLADTDLWEKINKIFKAIISEIGETDFYGSFWTAILRTNSSEDR